MELNKVRSGIINQYEMANGSRLVRISEDTEVKGRGRVTLTAWVNHGDTITRSRKYGTVKGAERWAREWLVS